MEEILHHSGSPEYCSFWSSSFSPPWKAGHFWDLGWQGGGGGGGWLRAQHANTM